MVGGSKLCERHSGVIEVVGWVIESGRGTIWENGRVVIGSGRGSMKFVWG